MALRTTFGTVIEQTRNEARLSSNTSRGIDHLEHIKQVITRIYKTLAEDYDWQHLELKRDSSVSRKLLQAGSRYYNFPTAVNPMKITGMWVKWGTSWLPVDYGITYADRTAFDPDDSDVRVDPIRKWMFYNGDQFEVWPLPATNGTADGENEVAFEGQKVVEDLTSTSSRLDMDDHLVVLMAAAELLAETKQPEIAQIKGAAAMARLARVRANMGGRTRVRMGIGVVNEGAGQIPRHPRWVR